MFGTPEPLPKSMLPEEIEKALKELGDDGAKVRGTLEREFASYVEKTEPKRRDLRSTLVFLLLPTARVLILASAGSSSSRSCRRRPASPSRWRRSARDAASRARGRLLLLPRGPRRANAGNRASRPVCDTRGWASGGMADAPALGAGAP